MADEKVISYENLADYKEQYDALLEDKLAEKEDVISDLSTIRSGAAAGATAYQKPVTGIPSSDIAEGVIPDVSSFITKSVNDLVNYYTKTETYTQTEVNTLIGAINQFHYEIAASTSAVTSPASNVLYLIGPTGSGADKYEEYVYANNTWTKIGDASIDLSGYVTTSALSTALADYTTTTDLTTLLAGKVDKVNGKGLSTEDFTTAEQTKLSGIETGAQVNVIETIKVNGSALTPSSKAVDITVPVEDVTLGGSSVVSNGTAVLPAYPTVPTISTDITTDATSDTKTTSPKAVKTFVEGKGYGTYSKPSGGIPASDIAAGVIPAPLKLTPTSISYSPTYETASITMSSAECAKAFADGSPFKFIDIDEDDDEFEPHGYFTLIGSDVSGIYSFLRYSRYIERSTYAGFLYLTFTNNNNTTYSCGLSCKRIPKKLSELSDDATNRLVTDTEKAAWDAKYDKPSGGIPSTDLASGVIPTVPTISTNIAADATSDTKTASPKAVKAYVDGCCAEVDARISALELDAQDLSLRDYNGNRSYVRNTANMYVVGATGTYCFPLVYGNGIKNGKANAQAYTRQGTTYTADFVNHLGNTITSPFIEQNTGCTAATVGLLWQTGTSLITSVSLVQGSDCKYIQFVVGSVPATNGVAVLWVKDGNGDIMWSWTIWLTADDLTPETYTNHTEVEYDMMPEAIGTIWNAERTKCVSPFYQWGRKDAVGLPAAYNSTTAHALYDIDGNAVTLSTYGVADDADAGGTVRSVSNAIKMPDKFFLEYDSDKYNWNNLDWFNNFWNAAITADGDLSDNQATAIKTIYDPCPCGYMLPAGRFATGFTTTGSNESDATKFNVVGSFDSGWMFKKSANDSVGAYWPASGCRDRTSGGLSSVGSNGYYWSFAPYSQANARYLIFSSGYVGPLNYYYRAYGFSVRSTRELT